jgi:hypothetical protein
MNKYYAAVFEDERWVIHSTQGWEYEEAKLNYEILAIRHGWPNVMLLYRPITTINASVTIPVIRSSASQMTVEPE